MHIPGFLLLCGTPAMAAPQVPDGGDGGGHFSLLLLSVVVFLFNKLVFYDKFFF